MTEHASLRDRPLVQVALTSTDLARTTRFYRDVLGLPLLFEVSGMVFFQLPGQRLMLGLAERGKLAPGGSVLYFDAPDIDSLGAALEAKGIEFHGAAETLQRTETHELKLRSFKDPDGNSLALMGMVPKKTAK